MSEFVSKASDETKKKRELKFQLYIDTYIHEQSGGWGVILLDRQDKKSTESGRQEIINVEHPYTFELLAVIKGLELILSSVPVEDHRYTSIDLFTDSLYSVNLLKEWLDLWTDTLDSRPHSELLHIVNKLRKEMNIKAKYCGKSNNEYMWAAEKLAKEQVVSDNHEWIEDNSNLNN